MKRLVIGTRGSKLALIQTELAASALRNLRTDLTVDTKIITTKGDTNFSPIPLDTVGKAWFTAEIEQELQAGSIDLAVHSLKDLPPQLAAGLTAVTVLERADPRDVLISRSGAKFIELPAGAVIGTDSLRRRAATLHARPDLNVASLRGNVETRLHKLRGGECDAIILAAAGLERLDRHGDITEFLDPGQFVPAAGQGALSAEFRADDAELGLLIKQLQRRRTILTTTAESAFTAVVGGGCKLPVGCLVELLGRRATVHALVGDESGANATVRTATSPAADAPKLAAKLARELVAVQLQA